MKYFCRFFVLLLIVICMSTPSFCANITKSFSPAFEIMSGETKYIMDIKQFNHIKSELIFPLDYSMIGGIFEVSEKRENRDYWSLLINFSTSVKKPSNEFKDYDWYYGITDVGDFEGMFSSTAHNVKGSQNIISLEGKIRLRQTQKSSLYFWAGYRYQKIKQDDINLLEGSWGIDIQNDPTFTVYEYARDNDFHGIHYEISYSSPFAGLITNQYPHRNLELIIKAAVLITSFSDFDDHLCCFCPYHLCHLCPQICFCVQMNHHSECEEDPWLFSEGSNLRLGKYLVRGPGLQTLMYEWCGHGY